MNKNFNSKEERYRTIRKLCIMDLQHRRKLEKIYNLVKSNRELLGGMDECFIYEMFSLDGISHLILDLFTIPKDTSYIENINKKEQFCRDYYNEIWDSYIESDYEEDVDDDMVVDSFISVMEREVMELDIKSLNKKEK